METLVRFTACLAPSVHVTQQAGDDRLAGLIPLIPRALMLWAIFSCIEAAVAAPCPRAASLVAISLRPRPSGDSTACLWRTQVPSISAKLPTSHAVPRRLQLNRNSSCVLVTVLIVYFPANPLLGLVPQRCDDSLLHPKSSLHDQAHLGAG